MTHWMFDCRSVAQMVSESLDRQLPLSQRLGLRCHMLMCRFCARYRSQLIQMRQWMRRIGESVETPPSAATLPDEAREKIRQALADANLRNG